jgi:site-specific DNA-methyltransferase (adenine-specific)
MEDKPRLARKLTNPETWGKEGERMKFDAVVGNPPYQETTGGGSEQAVAATQAKPVFNQFVNQATELNPKYISMIIPARWYAGGIGLNEFREKMLHDRRISRLVDYSNSKDCFPTVDIAGGLCYFLWENNRDADCTVINHVGNETTVSTRSLDEFSDMFIRSNQAISIIHKVRAKAAEFMDQYVQPIDAFGFPSKARGNEEYTEGSITLIHSQGTGYIQRDEVKKNVDMIDKYKVTIGILVPSNGEVGIDPEKGFKSITMPRILAPGEVTTFSYLVLNALDTEQEAIAFKNYMLCKFTRFMMRVTYSSMHISRANFVFVPAMDFTRQWSDTDLYNYFELTADEIALIEKTMRPME